MAVSKAKFQASRFVPDDHQREAIEHTHGPMLVVAGAGTGKTSVLIHRIAHLVQEGHAKPEQIRALTYTVEAAAQMRDRVRALLGQPIHSATFHDYCYGLLTRAGKKFDVLDEKDLWIFLRKRIHDLHLEHYIRAPNVGKFLSELLNFLTRFHHQLLTPNNYPPYVARPGLAWPEANIFGVGAPDQAIYRFRGASSAAFQLFRRNFPQTRLVVLGKNRRSITPILQCAFAVVDKNPPVFAAKTPGTLAYRRTPLVSAREEEAKREATPLPVSPVEAISFARKEAEAPDVVRVIEETKRHARCKWKDFAILYRSHTHRDEVVQELAEHEIPFSIDIMDVSDTPDVRDLFACVDVVVDLGSDAGLFPVAALPQFNVDPEQLRAAMRAIAKDSKQGITAPLSSILDTVAGGRAVLDCCRRAREEVTRKQAKTLAALQLIAKQFELDLNSAAVPAAFTFASDSADKASTQTKELGEWIEYLSYFREASGVIPIASKPDEDAVRLMTAHAAKGLEFSHVFILRGTGGSFPAGYRENLVEFPRELRDPDSAAAGDDETPHDQAERRLFS